MSSVFRMFTSQENSVMLKLAGMIKERNRAQGITPILPPYVFLALLLCMLRTKVVPKPEPSKTQKKKPVTKTSDCYKVKELREKIGISQDQLAKHLGYTRHTVACWEKGVSLPGEKVLVKINTLKVLVDRVGVEAVRSNMITTETGYEGPSPEQIKELRDYLGGRDVLAKRVGVRGYTVVSWEQGRVIPCPLKASILRELISRMPK